MPSPRRSESTPAWSSRLRCCSFIRSQSCSCSSGESLATKKQITEEQFINSIAHLEFEAGQARQIFYWTKWLPNAIKHFKTSNPSYWYCPADFDEWIASEKEAKTGYYRYYAHQFSDLKRTPEFIGATRNSRFVPATEPADDSVVLEYKLGEPSSSWTGLGLTDAEISHAEALKGGNGVWRVKVDFTPLGHTKYLYMMSELLGSRIAVFVNGRPAYGADTHGGITVVQPIAFEVPGYFREDQARELADTLNKSASQRKPVSGAVDGHGTETDFLRETANAKSLSANDLIHGENQVAAMIADRPEMAKFVKNGDAIWKWTARQFAGERTRTRVFWGGNVISEPYKPYVCETIFDTTEKIPHIRLASFNKHGVAIDGEMLWCAAVYELINAGKVDMVAIERQAESLKVSRYELIPDIRQTEYDSWIATGEFYQKVWRPHAKKNNLTATDAYWRTSLPKAFNPRVYADQFVVQHKPLEL